MTTLFRQMTICGVGLIGGSLAQIARDKGLVERIVGLGRTQANLDVAIERGLIDFATRDPAQAAAGANLVVLASPILAMPPLLAEMVPHLPADAVITDVGSVKGWVIDRLEPLLGPAMALVAAHPVAGKETTGAAAADPELFAGRRVIITPSTRSTAEAIERVEQLWLATGARVEQMPAAVHDQILARASHLPQLISSALGAALAEERIAGRFAAAFGAGGLRDTTRLALSSPEMWRDICVTNREAILQALALFTASIENFRRLVEAGDAHGLEAALRAGQGVGRHLAAAPAASRAQPSDRGDRRTGGCGQIHGGARVGARARFQLSQYRRDVPRRGAGGSSGRDSRRRTRDRAAPGPDSHSHQDRFRRRTGFA